MQKISSSDIVATWFVADQKIDASSFPQTGSDSSTSAFQDIYWRCVACFFATLSRQAPESRRIFFTNQSQMPTVDGLDFNYFFSKLNVEVVTLRTVRRLGATKVKAWNNQFFILDIIEYLASMQSYSTATVMDSDCVWVRSPASMVHDINRRGLISLCQPYPDDFLINGVSRTDMIKIAFQLTGRAPGHTPHYSGGEIFASSRQRVVDVWKCAQPMWDRLINSTHEEIALTEEGQFLSIIYDYLDIPFGTADAHCRRMWTALRLNNVSAEDKDSGRCVWHLPMEKKTGFADLFNEVRDDKSWLWNERTDYLREKIARIMGIPRRNTRQSLKQIISRLGFHLERLNNKADSV